MGYARHVIEEILKELEEKRIENQEHYDADADRYWLGRADAFDEAADYISSEFM